jgi:clan AA aspartic protease
MGLVRANFVLTIYSRDKRVCIDALVDTGTTEVIVTPEVAQQLGFDLEEVSRTNVTLADGRRVSVPRLRGVEVHFGDRSFLTEAIVLGTECMTGVIPLEGMDLVVDPKREQLVTNPKHPDGPCLRV